MNTSQIQLAINSEDLYLANSATIHTICKNKRYFSHLKMQKTNMSTISGSTKIIEGSRRVNKLLPRGTKFQINDALYSPMSQRNLLSFKYIRHNGYHIETISEGNDEYIQIMSIIQGNKNILEKLFALSSNLY
ncbi:hypothetical protein ES319_A03G120800v1 [Gossypium barbadense]|uniref:Retrovirus-related Pol polyprotein from transposon TNT 1-94-like beta-barrel domain-containing protein n=2 Tax=Gossypium TaxID=3633 RepID=A0A5J5WDY5_GOSBA|nr:hypothetical protein ES319_A03G120800v1 [Gossypium barbadense]TYH25005.1 hypothetical protein ES288_A03G135200v1 [Gossypium darwinii]